MHERSGLFRRHDKNSRACDLPLIREPTPRLGAVARWNPSCWVEPDLECLQFESMPTSSDIEDRTAGIIGIGRLVVAFEVCQRGNRVDRLDLGQEASRMGDEVNPVIDKLEQRCLELSSLHNHLLHETPRVMFEPRWTGP